jgi:uncharacterized protein YbjT (DUF2867 family)
MRPGWTLPDRSAARSIRRDDLGLVGSLTTVRATVPAPLYYFRDKTRQEDAIAASHVEWVVVRPGGLTTGANRDILGRSVRPCK